MNIVLEKGLKKVYISGPISGIEDANRKAFKDAEDRLTKMNFEVINPHNLFSQEEMNKLEHDVTTKVISFDQLWSVCMKRDIKALMDCEFVAVLPYWESSRGANLEIAIAKAVGMPIINAVNMQEITTALNFSINKYQKL